MTACHESKIQFNCSRCSMKFYTKKALVTHLEGISETIVVPHACKYCDFKSCRAHGLKAHEKRAHLNLSIDSLYGSVKKEENIDNVNAKEDDVTPGRNENPNDSGDFSGESEEVENDNENAPVRNDDDNGQVDEIAVVDSEKKDLPQEFQEQSENTEESDDQDESEDENEDNAQNLNDTENNPMQIEDDSTQQGAAN